MTIRRLLFIPAMCVALTAFAADEPTVHVEQPHLQGPRELQDQTAKAVVQDYLDAWQSMGKALAQNRPDLLNRDFVGAAKERLAATIKQQIAAGVHTTCRDRSHHGRWPDNTVPARFFAGRDRAWSRRNRARCAGVA